MERRKREEGPIRTRNDMTTSCHPLLLGPPPPIFNFFLPPSTMDSPSMDHTTLEVGKLCWKRKCSNEAKFWCARCREAKYCSRDCQKVHWHVIHTKNCRIKSGRDLPSRAHVSDPSQSAQPTLPLPSSPQSTTSPSPPPTSSSPPQSTVSPSPPQSTPPPPTPPQSKPLSFESSQEDVLTTLRAQLAQDQSIRDVPNPKRLMLVSEEWERKCDDCKSDLYMQYMKDTRRQTYLLGYCVQKDCPSRERQLWTIAYRVLSSGNILT